MRFLFSIVWLFFWIFAAFRIEASLTWVDRASLSAHDPVCGYLNSEPAKPSNECITPVSVRWRLIDGKMTVRSLADPERTATVDIGHDDASLVYEYNNYHSIGGNGLAVLVALVCLVIALLPSIPDMMKLQYDFQRLRILR